MSKGSNDLDNSGNTEFLLTCYQFHLLQKVYKDIF